MTAAGAEMPPGTARLDAAELDDLERTFAAALALPDARQARSALLDAGWLESLAADEAASVAVVFALQGRTRRDVAALDDVVAGRLLCGGSGAGSAADLADVTGGAAPGAVAVGYPLVLGDRPTVVAFAGHHPATRLLWTPDDPDAPLELIELDHHGGGAIAAAGVELGGADPELGLVALTSRPPGVTRATVDREAWGAAVAAGRVALAHQLAGGARAVLEMTVSYARQRRQFDTPIAAFQAVKHRLSETLVAVETAEASALAAATNGDPTAAAVAKALAGRASEVAGRNCLQVLGGVGFTLEHDFQRFFRRALVLGRLLGDRRTIERDLGRELRSGGLGGNRFVEVDQLPPPALLARLSDRRYG